MTTSKGILISLVLVPLTILEIDLIARKIAGYQTHGRIALQDEGVQ
jgi:hypothetical protein